MSLMSFSNFSENQFQNVITPESLRSSWLFGITLSSDAGLTVSDPQLQYYIDAAVSWLEHDLDISIVPRTEIEVKDYFANDYEEWGFLQLNRFPILQINSLEISYLRDDNQNDEVIITIPPAWFRLRPDTGILRLVPNNKFPSNLQIDAVGSFFPELFRRHGQVPDLWKINYTWGFQAGKVPVLVNQAVGLLAAISTLSVASHLVLGAGIASTSLSLDSLSQTINTTQSPENSTFNATRKEYTEALFGKTPNDPNCLITILRNYYKGSNLLIV